MKRWMAFSGLVRRCRQTYGSISLVQIIFSRSTTYFRGVANQRICAIVWPAFDDPRAFIRVIHPSSQQENLHNEGLSNDVESQSMQRLLAKVSINMTQTANVNLKLIFISHLYYLNISIWVPYGQFLVPTLNDLHNLNLYLTQTSVQEVRSSKVLSKYLLQAMGGTSRVCSKMFSLSFRLGRVLDL